MKARWPRVASLVPVIALAAGAAQPPPILIAVGRGASLARVEEARAAVPDSWTPVTVASARRAELADGFELVTDGTFSDAPPAELIVVLPGVRDAALEEFLRSRRSTARAILFLSDSPLAQRLRDESARGAVVLVGGAQTIRALVEAAEVRVPSPTASPSATATPIRFATMSPTPTATPRPSPRQGEPGNVFDRYFGAAPTRTPMPR